MQADAAHRLLLQKQQLENTRKRMLADDETALIEAAKRDYAINQIEDDEIRKNLQKQIDELRVAYSATAQPSVRQNQHAIEMEIINQKIEQFTKLREDYRLSGDYIRQQKMDDLIEREIEKMGELSAAPYF